MSAITIHYRATRGTVWRWYWRLWRVQLWKIHANILLFTVMFALIRPLPTGDAPRSIDVVVPCAIATALVIALILYPQLRFKPQERRLSIDANGIDSQIGQKSCVYAWDKIDTIEVVGTELIMRKNLNAFIVPQHAFASPADREHFRTAAERWRAEATQ